MKLRAAGLLTFAAVWSLPYVNYVIRYTPIEGDPEPFSANGSSVWAFAQLLLVAVVLLVGIGIIRASPQTARAIAWLGLGLLLALCVAAIVDDWVRHSTLRIAYRRLPTHSQHDPVSDLFFHFRSPWQAVLVGTAVCLALVVSRIGGRGGRIIREALAKGALVVTPLVLALGLLEAGLRTGVIARHWGAFARGRQIYRTNWCLGWSNRESTTTLQECPEFAVMIGINQRGLRGRLHPYDPPEDRCRLLCLGDSFTLGSGVHEQETYTEVLNGLLPSVDCLNAGTIGYGTAQEYLYYMGEGHRYQADLVILGMFTGNDFVDNTLGQGFGYPKPKFVLGPHGLELTNVTPAATKSFGKIPEPVSLLRASWAWQLIVRLPELSGPRSRPATEQTTAEPTRTHSAEDSWPQQAGPDWLARQPYRKPDTGFKVTQALLVALRQACQTNGAELLVLLIPERLIVGPHPGLGERSSWLTRLGQYRAGREVCRNAGLPFVDTLDPLLEAARRGAKLYYVQDGHWTSAAHEIAARELQRQIREHELLAAQCLSAR